MFNLAVDEEDELLSFGLQWVAGLAQRMDEVTVITMREGRHDLPGNVKVLSAGGERGLSEPRRAANFYRHLFAALAKFRPGACFSHMNQVFSALAGPVLWAARIPLFTWYTHRQGSFFLRAAHAFSRVILTAESGSYPYSGAKVRPCGHGIDTGFFSPHGDIPGGEDPLILMVSRLSPIKGIETVLQALGALKERGLPFRAAIVGAEPGGKGDYTQRVKMEINRMGLGGIVKLPGKASREEVLGWYRMSSVHVNASPPGSFDKVALEAMSCSRPSLVCNEGFRETLGDYADLLLFRKDDPADLADRLEALLGMDSENLRRMGAYLRERVIELHSLDRLLDLLAGFIDSDNIMETGGFPAGDP